MSMDNDMPKNKESHDVVANSNDKSQQDEAKLKELIKTGLEKGKGVVNKGKEKGKTVIQKTAKKNIELIELTKNKIKEMDPERYSEFEKKANKTLKNFTKDIEISKRQFLVLYLITMSLGSIFFMSIRLGLQYFTSVNLFGISFVIIGIFIGILVSAFLIDRYLHRYPYIIITLALSSFAIVFQAFADKFTIYSSILMIISLFINSIIFGSTAIFLMTLNVEYTSLLERGRITGALLAFSIITLGPIIIIASRRELVLIPIFIPIITSFYLYKHKSEEKYELYAHKKRKGIDILAARGQYNAPISEEPSSDSPNISEESEFSLENGRDTTIPSENESNTNIINVPKTDEQEQESLEEYEDSVIQTAEGNKHAETIQKTLKNRAEKSKQDKLRHLFPVLFNKVYLKELLLTASFALITGMIIPIKETDNILRNQLFESYFFITIFIIGIIIDIIILAVGMIFDFFGRKVVLSSLLLLLGVLTFFMAYLEQKGISITYQYIGLSLALVVSLIIIIPLSVGELVEPLHYGRSIAVGVLISILGISIGIFVQSKLENIINQWQLINLLALFTMYILIYIHESISHIELEWPDSLYHLYIIHESGMLLYDYSFRQEDDLVVSDLVSGGIIGLVTMLKEIVKGKDKLRAIDHGDKKIMFMWSSDEKIIFVLITKYELVVLRNKLRNFVNEFEEIYKDKYLNLMGVAAKDWEDVGTLINKYFSRKYISENIIDELEKIIKDEV
ncbi:MAG: hypothetical protein ACTSU2_16290 [Promethearchaeota archaeon]